MASDRVTQLAQVGKPYLRNEQDKTVLYVSFHYGEYIQDTHYSVDNDFIWRFYMVCGKRSLQECDGAIVLVTHDSLSVYRIDPLPWDKESTRSFDIEEWGKEVIEKWEESHTDDTLITDLYKVHTLLERVNYGLDTFDSVFLSENLLEARVLVDTLLARYNLYDRGDHPPRRRHSRYRQG